MKVAVVGATGMVGNVMLEVLAERNFPITELLVVASENSVGKKVMFKGHTSFLITGNIEWQTSILQKLMDSLNQP